MISAAAQINQEILFGCKLIEEGFYVPPNITSNALRQYKSGEKKPVPQEFAPTQSQIDALMGIDLFTCLSQSIMKDYVVSEEEYNINLAILLMLTKGSFGEILDECNEHDESILKEKSDVAQHNQHSLTFDCAAIIEESKKEELSHLYIKRTEVFKDVWLSFSWSKIILKVIYKEVSNYSLTRNMTQVLRKGSHDFLAFPPEPSVQIKKQIIKAIDIKNDWSDSLIYMVVQTSKMVRISSDFHMRIARKSVQVAQIQPGEIFSDEQLAEIRNGASKIQHQTQVKYCERANRDLLEEYAVILYKWSAEHINNHQLGGQDMNQVYADCLNLIYQQKKCCLRDSFEKYLLRILGDLNGQSIVVDTTCCSFKVMAIFGAAIMPKLQDVIRELFFAQKIGCVNEFNGVLDRANGLYCLLKQKSDEVSWTVTTIQESIKMISILKALCLDIDIYQKMLRKLSFLVAQNSEQLNSIQMHNAIAIKLFINVSSKINSTILTQVDVLKKNIESLCFTATQINPLELLHINQQQQCESCLYHFFVSALKFFPAENPYKFYCLICKNKIESLLEGSKEWYQIQVTP